MEEFDKLIELLEELYPDKMVVGPMEEWRRFTLAGKIELIKEIKEIIKRGL